MGGMEVQSLLFLVKVGHQPVPPVATEKVSPNFLTDPTDSRERGSGGLTHTAYPARQGGKLSSLKDPARQQERERGSRGQSALSSTTVFAL